MFLNPDIAVPRLESGAKRDRKVTAELEIRRRIESRGAITFAEFMDVALYWPQGGYYTGISQRVGAQGDYYTSPMVHPAFGAAISVQLLQMWRLLGSPSTFDLLELGAGNGMLCRDIMAYSEHLPGGFVGSLRYLCVDLGTSPAFEAGITDKVGALPKPRAAQRAVASVIPGGASPGENKTPTAPQGLPFRNLHGCILTNELLDAFPVHQVAVQDGQLREVYISLDGEELSVTLGETSTPELENRLNRLGVTLEEGQTAEINLGLAGWSRTLAQALSSGFVLTVDYGRPAPELYSAADRKRGTLTAFYRHTQTDAPLRHVGSQDITAQVDFTSVVEEGRRAGLTPVGLTPQGRFLGNLGLSQWQRRLATLELSQRAVEANRAGMVDLARQGGLGDFKVLVQGKRVERSHLWGIQRAGPAQELTASLPVPLLTQQHLNLIQGRYLASEMEFEGLWPVADPPELT